MSFVRVRFAPSPTGYLHVGGARTAIFNWLFARSEPKGTFLLRIEDTDKERSTDSSIQEIISSLSWLGLNWDGEPVRQSERIELYRKEAEALIQKGCAYTAEPDSAGGRAILFKMPKEIVEVQDGLRGKVTFDNQLQKDLVLIKSDGMPAYQFACVVDDALMKITHVIRGDDHLSNTPKQIPLYHAMNFPTPKFIHVPMILGPDGTRLSKRHGATSVEFFKEKGILAESLFNYLTLLGWSPGENIEILTKKESIKRFKLERLNKRSAVFDEKKLYWMNRIYLKEMDEGKYLEDGEENLKKYKCDLPQPVLERSLKFLKGEFQVWEELFKQFDYFFFQSYAVDPSAVKKYLKSEEASFILAQIQNSLKQTVPFNEEVLEKNLRALAENLGIKAGAVIHPLRVALTGKKVSPGIFETCAVLGQAISLHRVQQALDSL